MIVTYGKPLNPGEENTVRLIMSISEATRLRRWIQALPSPPGERWQPTANDLWRCLEIAERDHREHEEAKHSRSKESTGNVKRVELGNPHLLPITCGDCGKPIEGTVWVGKVIGSTLQPGAFHVACPAPVSPDYPGVAHIPTALLTPNDEVHEGTTSLPSGRKL